MSVKTLRFGPLPGTTTKDGTTPPRDTWDKFIDIPPDTRVRIVAMPGGQIIVDELVTRSFSKDFDPGKYRYVMKKDLTPPGDGSPGTCARVEGEFLVDVTEAQWARLQHMSPRAAKASQTSDGPAWSCKMPGCGARTSTRLSAFLHESREHFGIDPIKEPEKVVEVQIRGGEVASQLAAAAKKDRGGSDRDVLNDLAAGVEG